ncbi:MAG TPA: universal stress protein [Xanthobacteraceae bacterium]|jgi:nucleotide-binding universal stress UspA family protein
MSDKNGPAILLALDGCESTLTALPIASVLGDIEQASVRILCVTDSDPPAELLDRVKHETRDLEGFSVDARTGEPSTQILRMAQELKPQIIVLCRHIATAAQNALGSTATRVLREVACPLVLVSPERGLTAWRLHHVLVPHDGTPSTSVALRPAAEIAEHAGAELVVVHVTDVRPAPTECGSLTVPPYVDQPQHEWPAWSSEFVKRIACVCPLGHVHVRLTLAHGNPPAQLLRLAKAHSTDLMVLAWRGVWETPRAAIFKDLIGEAHCPVMVVRT